MLIVGLGNPGDQFRETRHNVGFKVIDILAVGKKIKLKSKRRYISLIGEGAVESRRVILAKPQTYMNRSGMALKLLVEGFGVGLGDLLIIYDDANLPLGQLRIRKAGGGGGHKGVGSIIEVLGTSEFLRLRVGIGSPKQGIDLTDYVLSGFEEDEKGIVGDAIKRAAQAVEEIVIFGIEVAMNKFNSGEWLLVSSQINQSPKSVTY